MEEFDEEFTGSAGSFFNWFATEGEDDMGLAETLLEWWSHATEYVFLSTCRGRRIPLASSANEWLIFPLQQIRCRPFQHGFGR